MVVRNVGVLSAGKILGALYAILGLLFGGLMSMVAMAGVSAAGPDLGPLGVLFGVGAVVLLPLFYGMVGLIGGIVAAALYNVLAGMIGGLEVDIS